MARLLLKAFGLIVLFVCITWGYVAFIYFSKEPYLYRNAPFWTDILSFGLSLFLKPFLKYWNNLPEAFFNGHLEIDGLHNSVYIHRMQNGNPYIYASDDHDLYMAQGFIHATERTWQLESLRLLSSGRLSEVLGEKSLSIDIYSRTLGFHENAKKRIKFADPSDLAAWDAYAIGVSAALKSLPTLPVEFTLLSHKPNPTWTVLDSLKCFGVISLIMSNGRLQDISRQVLKLDIRDSLFDHFDVHHNKNYHTPADSTSPKLFDVSGNPVPIPSENDMRTVDITWASARPTDDNFAAAILNGIDASTHSPPEFSDIENYGSAESVHFGVVSGSNGWVVSGNLSETGRPILSGDMHLDLVAPSFWMPIGLIVTCMVPANPSTISQSSDTHAVPQCTPKRAVGVGVAGFPGIQSGHNNHFAWSATLSLVDNEDLFIIRSPLHDDNSYEYNGEYWPFVRRIETFIVKGYSNPVQFICRSTHHGPLLSDVQPALRDLLPDDKRFKYHVALASVSLRAHSGLANHNLWHIESLYELMKTAYNMHEAALLIVSASAKGDTGTFLVGGTPIRKDVKKFFRDGWLSEQDWQGLIPFSKTPMCLNNPRGFELAANGPMMHFSEDIYGFDFSNGVRAERIYSFLNDAKLSGTKLSNRHMANMQMDTYDMLACEFLTLFFPLDPFSELDQEADGIVKTIDDMFSKWDCVLRRDGVEGTIVHTWINFAIQEVLQCNVLSDRAAEAFIGVEYHPIYGKLNIFRTSTIPTLLYWIKTTDTTTKRNTLFDLLNHCDPYIGLFERQLKIRFFLRSLNKAIEYLSVRYTSNSTKWDWGSVRTHLIQHSFGESQPILAHSLSPGYVPGTGGETLNSQFIPPQVLSINHPYESNRFDAATSEPSMRMIVDVGNWENSQWVVPPGVSGWIASEHYLDQLQPYIEGKFFPMLWLDSDIMVSSKSCLTLRSAIPPDAGPPKKESRSSDEL